MAFYSTAPTKRAACSAIGSPYLGARLIQKKQGWNLGRFSWLGRYSVYRAGTGAGGRSDGSAALVAVGCDLRAAGAGLAWGASTDCR